MSHRHQHAQTTKIFYACRRLVATLASCLVLTFPAMAQIEWFAADQMSYISARAYASVGMEIDDRCVFANLQEPKSCPWCRQFDPCRRLQLSPGAGATTGEKVRVDAQKPPMLDATSRAAFGQGIDFQPDGFRMDLRVATDYSNRGTHGPGNRGIGTVDGEVYLRVPDGTTIEYAFDGRMQWTAATALGRIQIVGVPNTGADLSAGFAFHAHQLPGGSPATLSHRGSLKPGLYRLLWSIGVDSVGRQAPQGFDLLAEFKVQKTSWPQCVPDGALTASWTFPSTEPLPMTPMPPSAGRSTPESPLVDINLDAGSTGAKFGSMRRQRLDEAGLPMNSCVVVAHGDPDSVADTRGEIGKTMSATDLANEIVTSNKCLPNEPIVLLSCNTGRPKNDASPNFAEQLARALQNSGWKNATVWAPTAYVEAPSTLPVLTEPHIVLDSTNINDWLWYGHLSPPQAVREIAPGFVPYTAR